MTAAGRVGGAPLERVQPPRRLLVVGVAAHPVHGVRRKHRDAAGSDALLQALHVLRADRLLLVGLRSHHLCRSATTTRWMRARSRSNRIASKPAARVSSATAAACPAPTSIARKRTSGSSASCPSSVRMHASPSGPANSACAGSWRSISGASASRSDSATYGGLASDRVELQLLEAAQQVGVQPVHVQPQALAVGARELERGLADVAAADVQVGALVLERERHRAAAGADVEHARARAQPDRRPRPAARSPAAGSAREDRRSAPGGESRAGRRCRRRARARPRGGAPRPGTRAPPSLRRAGRGRSAAARARRRARARAAVRRPAAGSHSLPPRSRCWRCRARRVRSWRCRWRRASAVGEHFTNGVSTLIQAPGSPDAGASRRTAAPP